MRLLLLLSFALFSLISYSQSKKPVNKPATSLPKPVKDGPLKKDDYNFYVIVTRTLDDNPAATKDYYTANDSNSPYRSAIIDVRTGKEVALWPNLKSQYSKQNNGLYIIYKNSLSAYTSSGIPVYRTMMNMPQDSPYKGINYFLSSDWKKVVIPFNKDIVVGEFDLKTGKVSNPKQVTFSGIFDFEEAYMKGDHVITSRAPGSYNYIVNTATGKHVVCGDWTIKNKHISQVLYTDDTSYPKDQDAGYWNIVDQTFKLEKPFVHIRWIDEQQTKYIAARYLDDRPTEYYEVDALTKSKKKLEWPLSCQARDIGLLRPSQGVPAMNTRYIFSPNSERFVGNVRGLFRNGRFTVSERDGSYHIFIYNLKNNTETPINLSQPGNNSISWVDDTHFFFNALDKITFIDGVVINTETQGTYVFDSESKKFTRISSYMMTENQEMYADTRIKFVRIPDSDLVVFEANNFLFRCKSDGSELKPLFNFPGVYSLERHFLSKSYDLE